MSAFTEEMEARFSKELAEARRDPHRMAEFIELLTRTLAAAIATGARGRPVVANELLEGASSQMFEIAADHAALAEFMARF